MFLPFSKGGQGNSIILGGRLKKRPTGNIPTGRFGVFKNTILQLVR